MGFAIATLSVSADAFTTATFKSAPCHEEITLAAIGTAGWPDGKTPPPLDETGHTIADDGFFLVPPTARDPWTLALIEGVRHNDVRGQRLTDLVNKAVESADPAHQREHCLRAPHHDGADGDAQAILACRDFILEQVGLALGDGDAIDLTVTESVQVTLVFRGPIELEMNRYGLHMGHALHALQDSFSHSFRHGRRVTHVLNYVDYVEATHDPVRDGFRHLSKLDRCSDDLDAQHERVRNATTASADLLTAVADSTGGRSGRLARARSVLDHWLELERGCTFENRYCDASELREPDAGGCSLGTHQTSDWWLVVALLMLWSRRPRSGATRSAAACSLMAALIYPRSAGAEPTRKVVTVDPERKARAVVERRTVDALDEGAPVNRGLGLHLGTAGSLDQASFAVSAGMRLDIVRWFTVGLDVEFNPWFSIESQRAALGTSNVYLPLVFTWTVNGPVEFRSTLAAGVSILNFDLVGAEQGSVGPFVGTTPIGIALRVSRGVRVVIDPGGITFSVPQTRGVPLVYREHRLTVGVQLTP